MNPSETRVETLLVARAFTLQDGGSESDLVTPLARFCPSQLTPAAWREQLGNAAAALCPRILDDAHRLVQRDELRKRIGDHHVTKWVQLADCILPALALGVAADDTKSHAKLKSADAWAAAIAGRALAYWKAGPPPSASALCDSFAWSQLGLSGKPKRLPAEVRSLFLQKELDAAPSRPDRLLRQLAARELAVPRADARSLRDGLVRAWLAERVIGMNHTASFAEDVAATARDAHDGVFGDRKVFISEVWRALRLRPPWASVSLEEFKARLLDAHRAGQLVLARADLVAAMNPEHVAASETTANGASFHFIVRGAP
jgi:hypothetical protein